jgi:hypothetical protein
MAYFAKIDENGKVVSTHVVHDSIATTEEAGQNFLNKTHGRATWVQNWKTTLAEGNPRKRPASVGFIYDAARDAFIEESTFASWVLDEADCVYKPPIPPPDPQPVGDGTFRPYNWNEATQTWDLAPL